MNGKIMKPVRREHFAPGPEGDEHFRRYTEQAEGAQGEREEGCCCPPKGFSGSWAAGPCPVHMGLRRAALVQPYLDVVGDLTALVGKLVQKLRKAAPNEPLAEKAADYLRRNNLMSPLRDEAQPSPAPELELERPEVVAHVDGSDEDWFIQPEDETELHDEGLLFAGCELGRMVDFDRIIAELHEEREGAESQAEYQASRAEHFAKERDAAQARVAELEKQEPIGKCLSESEMGIGFERRAGPVIWFGTPKPGFIYAAPVAQAGQVPDIDDMVSRFLAWPLPANVCADLCATMPGEPYRSGTNLLSGEQAKAMLEHVVAGVQSEINVLREQNAKLEAEAQALREEVAAYEDGMRSLAFQLGAGGFNSENLTAAQLLDKVQWGINNLTETQGRLLDEVRSERDALRARVVVPDALLSTLRTEFPLFDEVGLDEKEHCCEWSILHERKRLHRNLDELSRLNGKAENEALRKDAERYRWLRDEGYLDNWVDAHVCDEHLRPERTDAAIDAALEGGGK